MIALLYCPVKGNATYPPLSIATLSSYIKQKGHKTIAIDLNKELYVRDKQLADKISYYFALPSIFTGISDDANTIRNIDTIYNFSLFLSILNKDTKVINKDDNHLLSFVNEIEIEIEKIADELINKGIRFVGFSTYVSNIVYSCLLAKKLKEKNNKIITFFGGSSTSYSPIKDFLLEIKIADYIIVGEGENAVLRLIEDLNSGREITYNVLYSSNIIKGKLGDNEISVSAIQDLNDLPSPDFSDFDLSLYIPINKKYTILPSYTSRGCINKCAYCSETQYWNRFRQRSVASVINEIKQGIKNYNANCFFFHDSLINGNIKWLEDFCDYIINNNIGFHWFSFASVQNLNASIIKKMKDAGCISLTFGIEHTSHKMLKAMNKPTSLEKAKEVLEAAIKVGITPVANIIYGLPGEDNEDLINLLSFIALPQFIGKVYFTYRAFEIRVGSEITNNILKSNENIKVRKQPIYNYYSSSLQRIISEIDIYWMPDDEYTSTLIEKMNLINVFIRAQEANVRTKKGIIKRYDTNPILSSFLSKSSQPILNFKSDNIIENDGLHYIVSGLNHIEKEIIKNVKDDNDLEAISNTIFKEICRHKDVSDFDIDSIKETINKEVISNSITLTQKELLQWN